MKRLRICLRSFIILCSLVAVIEGRRRRMVKTSTTQPALETSSRSAWNHFHLSPDSATDRLKTSPPDQPSPRQRADADGIKTPPSGAVGSGGGGSVLLRRKRRQVDPLHSCIEAKCSSWKSTEYLNCIYHHCINGLESSQSRFGRDNMRHGSQAERTTSWKRQVGSGAGRLYRGKILMGIRAERSLPGTVRVGSQVEPGTMRSNEAGPLTPVVASVPGGAFLSMDVAMRRRGYNDISDVCRESNCGPYQQTIDYFSCIENIIDCPSLRL